MDQTISNAGSKPVRPLTEARKEKRYVKVQELIDSLDCIVQYELKLYIYDKILTRLQIIKDYKDSSQLVEQYTKIRQKHIEQGTEVIYQDMLQKKAQVTKAEDIQWVRKEAQRIPGYKDVDEVLAWCDNTFQLMEKQEQKKAIVRAGMVIVLFVAAIFAGYKLVGQLLGNDKDVANAEYVLQNQYMYEGEPVTVDLQVKLQDKVLKENIDYTITYRKNSTVGQAQAVVKGIGEYKGTCTVEYTIIADLERYSVYGLEHAVAENELLDRLLLSDGKQVLLLDRDYKASYTVDEQNKTAAVTLEGIGSYTGTKVVTCKIK